MKKVVFLVYGIVSYIVFFVTFCYAVGFVTSVFVPKHIDSPPGSPLAFALLMNAGLLSLFAVQHSVMARPGFKLWWTKLVPVQIERSTYVLLASLCLILLFWKWEPMGGIIWQAESAIAKTILLSVSLIGFGIVLLSTLLINHFDLFGLRQVWMYFTGTPYQPIAFRTPLFYKHIRHPLYLGFIIAFWAAPTMTAAHLFFAIMTTGYILIAIQLEERDLTKEFGASYQAYKESAAMLVPFMNFRKKS
jgi:methanethiol S-methyltransferase